MPPSPPTTRNRAVPPSSTREAECPPCSSSSPVMAPSLTTSRAPTTETKVLNDAHSTPTASLLEPLSSPPLQAYKKAPQPSHFKPRPFLPLTHLLLAQKDLPNEFHKPSPPLNTAGSHPPLRRHELPPVRITATTSSSWNLDNEQLSPELATGHNSGEAAPSLGCESNVDLPRTAVHNSCV
jgi:hypothetical protein